MKKMVCEICGSQSIKKENGVFVCQECGTEYSLEEAKKLLIEIDGNKVAGKDVEKPKPNVSDNKIGKAELLSALSSWLQIIYSFKDLYFWMGYSNDILKDETAFRKFEKDCKETMPFTFPKFDREYVQNHSILIEDEEMTRIYGFNILKVFSENSEFARYSKACANYGFKKIFCNGQGPFAEYFVYWNGDFGWGIPLEQIGGSTPDKKLFDMIDARKRGTRYGVNHDIIKHGIFGDKVIHSDASDILNINSYLDITEKILNETRERHLAIENFYNDNFNKQKNNYVLLLNEMTQLEKTFNLPFKYRDIYSVLTLIGFINDGRVDDWKEAINLFEQEAHQNRLELKMDAIGAYLIELNNTLNKQLSMINNQLANISSSVSCMAKNLDDCSLALKNIMFDTRYSLIRSII